MSKWLIISSLIIFCFSNNLHAKNIYRDNINCGIKDGKSLTNGYGPFDYTNPSTSNQKMLPRVINAHFTREVAKLNRGTTSETPHGDIDYTLRAIPNYHPALYSVGKLERQDRSKITDGTIFKPRYYSAECYFKRAIYFQPKDSVSRMLYAMHLHQIKQFTLAEQIYLGALAINDKNPELNYNVGLLYVDLNMLDKAQKHADIAYSAGYPLPGLRNKITKLSSK